MRITTQLLRSRAQKPLHSLEYLDLSSLGIERIEKLGVCSKLRTLSLSDNNIDYVSNLHACPQLWRLDLSNNVLKSLEGVSRFVALGSLVLSNNHLTWSELAKLRHVHILELSLHGNAQLEQDPYYRIHVIDCLPNVWMLDGRIITSAERLQVQHFFQDSALTDHPVRHKCAKEHFTTTQMKNISVNGVFGEKTIHLMRRFPTNGALNVDTDRRRLKYLAFSLQEDLKLEAKYNKWENRVIAESQTFLEDVLSIRQQDREKANMLLLLLVASLEFAVPIHLMKDTLDTTKLDVAVNVHTMDLFLLPRDNRCNIVSLLLSAVKVDKDMGEEGGLYDKLYLCLYHSVAELNKLAQASDKATLKMDKKSQAVYADSRSLIGAEVVQLMCIVPTFFDYITKDPGVMHLVTTATCDGGIVDRIRRVINKLEKESREPQYMCEEVADMILSAIQQNALNMLNRTKSSNVNNVDILLNMKRKALPRRPQSSPIFASEYHAKGRTTPRWRRSANERLKSAHLQASPLPQLGDAVLLGPQNVARIISIPEPDIVLVQMDVVPAETGAMVNNSRNPDEHYSYLDMQELYWDHLANYWRPIGTVGDRISIQAMDPLDSEHGIGQEARELPVCPSSTPSPPCSPRIAAATPTNQQHYNHHHQLAQKAEHVPRAVSAQLKERLNLKLQLSNDVTKPSAREADKATPIQVSGTPLASSPKETDTDAPESSQETTPNHPRHVNITAPAPSLQTAPSNVVVTVSDLGADTQEGVTSLEGEASDTSAELAAAETAAAANQEAAFISIDIPQMPQEAESVGGDASTRSVTHTAPGEGSVRESFKEAVTKSRQASARSSHPKGSFAMHTARSSTHSSTNGDAVGCKMIVAADKQYMSSYQTQRTEAWKNSKLTRPTSSVTVATPTMQRQSPQSPPSALGLGEDGGKRPAVRVLRGDSWLAGGRDLHWESRVSRPRTAHTPGWKEGLSPRPKSAAALRALKRNKSPGIVTPSSMAYDIAYGRGAQQIVPELMPIDYTPPPIQHGVRSDHFPLNFPEHSQSSRIPFESRTPSIHQYPTYWLAKSRQGPLCECCMVKHNVLVPGGRTVTCDHALPSELLHDPDQQHTTGQPPGPSAASTCSRSDCMHSEQLSLDGLTMKPVLVTIETLDVAPASAV